MEVAVGIEPTNKSFAGPGLTTWLRHQKMERETRFELATSTLARWSSTTELLPHNFLKIRTEETALSKSIYSLIHLYLNVKLIFQNSKNLTTSELFFYPIITVGWIIDESPFHMCVSFLVTPS